MCICNWAYITSECKDGKYSVNLCEEVSSTPAIALTRSYNEALEQVFDKVMGIHRKVFPSRNDGSLAGNFSGFEVRHY